MGYTDSLLADGESVARRSRQHWLALLLDSRAAIAVWVLAAALFAASALFDFGAQSAEVSNAIGVIVLILVVLGLLIFGYRWLSWSNQSYLITNRRILKVEGILNKRSADSSLEKINDLRLEENLLGRMLGYGDLDIITAADTAIDRFRMLDDAKEFKRVMLDQKHRLESGEDIRMPGPPLMASQPSPARPASSPEPAWPTAQQDPAERPAPQEPAWRTAPRDPAERPAPQEPAWQTAPGGPSMAAGTPSYAATSVEEGAGASWRPAAETDPVDDETRGMTSADDRGPEGGEAAAAETMSTGLPADAGAKDPEAITQTLARLADLRDRGAITSQEYEAKKAELLSRL